MQRIQLNSKDGLASGWIGVGDARNVPDRAHTSAPRGARSTDGSDDSDARDASGKRTGWFRAGFSFARNAAIGLALLMAVPFVAIGVLGGRFQRYDTVSARLRTKLESSERLRAFKAPVDASITPEEAGLAYRALQSGKASDEFPMRNPGHVHVRQWMNAPITSTMFVGVRNPTAPNTIYTAQVLYAASSELSSQELAYLRMIAEAPLWRDFDRVAAAESVDLIGGQYVLPFSAKAFAPRLPILRFGDTRELANAGVQRAAYYVAIRDFGRAEAALKSVVSYGFMLMDNATSALDATVGRLITGIGGDGLHQLYSIQLNDELMAAVRTPKEFTLNSAADVKQRVDPDVLRERLLNDVNNLDLPRGIRLESLRSLSFGACGNVREVLLGPDQQVRDAFANAKRTLARFPSEQAFLDLLFQSTERVPEGAGVKLGPERFIVGAATVAGVVLNNPRVAACTRMAMLSY